MKKKKPVFSKALNHHRHEFTDFQGKVLDRVDVRLDRDENENYIELRFQDRTAVLFIIQQSTGVIVSADYVLWRKGNWRRINRWPPLFLLQYR